MRFSSAPFWPLSIHAAAAALTNLETSPSLFLRAAPDARACRPASHRQVESHFEVKPVVEASLRIWGFRARSPNIVECSRIRTAWIAGSSGCLFLPHAARQASAWCWSCSRALCCGNNSSAHRAIPSHTFKHCQIIVPKHLLRAQLCRFSCPNP